MADKKAKGASGETIVVVKSHADSKTEKPVKKPVLGRKEKITKTVEEPTTGKKPNVFRRIGRYFRGSVAELRQVHWPNRSATWQLTIAVIVFSLFLGLVIFLLDWGFTYLFKEVIL